MLATPVIRAVCTKFVIITLCCCTFITQLFCTTSDKVHYIVFKYRRRGEEKEEIKQNREKKTENNITKEDDKGRLTTEEKNKHRQTTEKRKIRILQITA